MATLKETAIPAPRHQGSQVPVSQFKQPGRKRARGRVRQGRRSSYSDYLQLPSGRRTRCPVSPASNSSWREGKPPAGPGFRGQTGAADRGSAPHPPFPQRGFVHRNVGHSVLHQTLSSVRQVGARLLCVCYVSVRCVEGREDGYRAAGAGATRPTAVKAAQLGPGPSARSGSSARREQPSSPSGRSAGAQPAAAVKVR